MPDNIIPSHLTDMEPTFNLTPWEIFVHTEDDGETSVACGEGGESSSRAIVAVTRTIMALEATCKVELAIEDQDSLWAKYVKGERVE